MFGLKLTTVHVNAQIGMLLLTGLQAYILWELNGHLHTLLTAGCVEVTAGFVFAPVIAIAWIARKFAVLDDKREE